MDNRIIIGLIIVVILVAAGAGCFEEEKSSKKSGPSYEEVDGEHPSESGWIDDDGNQGASTTIPLQINGSEMITDITVTMRFEDSDAAHSESDDGSDPDEVTITLTNGIETSDPVSGTTPCNLQVQMGPNSTGTEEYISGTWEISIDGICNGGKPRFIFGFIIYIDQGIAYSLDVSYTYLEEK